ncbi:hypothetical protein AcW1_006166 [Taiwanofungus camphoratus]|nr:hypothetical protein AcW1_006166 [Antrodia cinnamomea]
MPLKVGRLVKLVPSFNRVLVLSGLLRIVLILYSEWHDAHSIVKYTDVDYRVFSDAARFVLHPSPGNHAQGPLGRLMNIGDPYTRATYRYTPLLAVLLTPNEWLHPSFGKYLFAGCDLLAGVLMYKLLLTVILPTAPISRPRRAPEDRPAENPAGQNAREQALQRRASFLSASHLFNPLVFTISTRGSSEAILSLLVLLTLYSALKRRWDAAAILLGLSTHWKIYPFIYGVSCLGVIGSETGAGKGWKGYLGQILNLRTLRFGLLSAATFFSLGALMYYIWGYPFVHESYLFHLHRLDHRHNFSPYFYLIYLNYPSSFAASSMSDMPLWRKLLRSPLTSFVPQMILTLGTGLLFGRRRDDLVFAWFVQTVIFVVFNKVCTSQYFLWYILFMPLLIPRIFLPRRRILICSSVWTLTQVLWLSEAYKLEFVGQNVFLGLWVRSLLYIVGNCAVLEELMNGYAR